MKIKPYKAIGPILLGTKPDDVQRVVGPAHRSSTNRRGEREEYWDGLIVRYAKDSETVVEVVLHPPAAAELDGIELFKTPERYKELCAIDGQPYECFGFLLLLNLGLVLSGFHDEDPSQRAIGIFERGRWDHMRSHFVACQVI